MIPQKGQHINCVLRNNIVVDGILEDWDQGGVKLKSLDDKRVILIMRPDDIMMITVFLEPDEEAKKIIGAAVVNPKGIAKLEEKFQEVYEQPSDNVSRVESLAELRIKMAETEKQMIVNKLRNHYIDGTKKVKYGYPGFLSKPRTK